VIKKAAELEAAKK